VTDPTERREPVKLNGRSAVAAIARARRTSRACWTDAHRHPARADSVRAEAGLKRALPRNLTLAVSRPLPNLTRSTLLVAPLNAHALALPLVAAVGLRSAAAGDVEHAVLRAGVDVLLVGADDDVVLAVAVEIARHGDVEPNFGPDGMPVDELGNPNAVPP